MAEQNPERASIGRTPKTLHLNGTRMMLALQEAGLNMEKLDLEYLLGERGIAEGATSKAEIQELQSELQTLRKIDWEIGVTISGTY
jgi:hypothetical protein